MSKNMEELLQPLPDVIAAQSRKEKADRRSNQCKMSKNKEEMLEPLFDMKAEQIRQKDRQEE